jgi:hypothetical protein
MTTERTATPASSTRDPHADLLREVRRLYKERVKPALKAGLLDVKPRAALDQSDYVVDVADNLLPGLPVADIKKELGAGAAASSRARCARRGHPPRSRSTRSYPGA